MNIHLDGFAHYGLGPAGVANMLEGAYAEISSMEPSTVNPRTGSICLRNTDASNAEFFRWVLPSTRQTALFGIAHIVEELPAVAATHSLFVACNNAATPLASVVLMTTGGIEVREGGVAGTIIAQGDPRVFADTWQHIEARFDRAGQTVEVRVDGVVAVSASGVDMGADPIAQVIAGPTSVLAANRNFAFSDFRVGDNLGGVNDDFMGDRRVFTLFPTGDGVPQEWTPDTGTDAYARIDEAAQDGDASYIQSDETGQLCRLTFDNLPAGIVAVGGIAFANFAKKTDAGLARMANNVISNGERGAGTEMNPAANYAYMPQQQFDLNPDGDIPWTPGAVDAIESELEHIGDS